MPHQRNIDMDLLRSFVTIIETKSFTRAAVRMARTQSAISLQMKRLEEQLETRLFERGGRGVEPTEAGVMLLSYARRILAANDELVGRLVEPDVEGDVLLRAPDGFAGQHLTSVLARFQRAFPLVRLQVATTPDGAVDAEPDLVLSTGLGRAPQGADELMRETLTWCVAEGSETVQSLGDSASPLPLVLPMGAIPHGRVRWRPWSRPAWPGCLFSRPALAGRCRRRWRPGWASARCRVGAWHPDHIG